MYLKKIGVASYTICSCDIMVIIAMEVQEESVPRKNLSPSRQVFAAF